MGDNLNDGVENVNMTFNINPTKGNQTRGIKIILVWKGTL